jgi:hypothetical protein
MQAKQNAINYDSYHHEMLLNALKPMPKFSNEAEEQAFWGKHDSTDYLDWTKAQRVVAD